MVPLNLEDLKKTVGVQNVDKSSVPVLAFNLTDPAGKKLKVQITPTEEDKGYGLQVMAFLNTTRVEGSTEGPSSAEYRKATRELAAVGLWPNKSVPSNLRSKLGRYNGGTETYSAENRKKTSWYKMQEVPMASKEGNPPHKMIKFM